MTSAEVVIQTEGLGKMHKIYEKPADRLKQMLWGRRSAKGYGRDFWALRDFSCTVRKGEMLGVIGRNGSGKSTLLQLLAGVMAPTVGAMRLHGRVSALLELGSGFNPEYSGRDNVFIAGAILGIGAREMEERYAAIANFAGIGTFIDQPVKTYSSGMAVRLAFAVASSVDPDILIIDEALAVGDMVFQQRCFRRFQEIRARGTSVVFVSHDLSAVVQYCDSAIVLEQGRMIGQGTAKDMADLYKRSLHGELRQDEQPGRRGPEAGPRLNLKDLFTRNPNCQEYGDGAATIIDWGVLDEAGAALRVNDATSTLRVVMTIRFHRACGEPIAAFTVRDLKGNELCGSNTLYEGSPIGPVKAGALVTIVFRLALPLQPGGASLCIACTEYHDGSLVVHHRLYDLLLIESASPRRFVGVFDCRPHLEIIRHD